MTAESARPTVIGVMHAFPFFSFPLQMCRRSEIKKSFIRSVSQYFTSLVTDELPGDELSDTSTGLADKTVLEGHNAFITGSGGTGKTIQLNAILKSLSQERVFAVTCTT